ncbi:MAG: hypothetical protein Q7S00_03825, partial [bacterium]|nr:hypothetical protein [bacterium]
MEILSKIISPATIILTGAILVALGGFWAGVRNNAIQNKLQEKTEEISKLNKHIVASVTGGDTYPYIRVEFAHIPRGLVILTLMSEGENPLYDVGVNLIDSDKYKFKDDIAYAEYLKRLKGGIDEGRKSMRIGNFRPNEVRNLSSFMMEDENGER